MDVLSAIEKRNSVRAYEPTPVGKEALAAIVKAGNLAPVFGRFHVTVITDPELLRDVNDSALEMMRRSGDAFLEKRASTEGYEPLYGAPAMIVLSAPGGNDGNGFNMANVSCAAENMIVEATELGLGTCFVMGPMISFADSGMLKKAEIPEGYVPLVGVLAGYPVEGLANNARKDPGNVTYLG